MSAQQSEIPQQELTAIADVNTAVAKFDRVAAGIIELKTKYEGLVYEVGTAKGMKEACDARAAIRAPRYEVEKVRKECKAPILALGKEIDARAAKITTELLALEAPVDSQIKIQEQRKEDERKAKAEAERRRVAEIQARIDQIRDWPVTVAGDSVSLIEQKLRAANDYEPTVELFGELLVNAQQVLAASRSGLTKLLEDARKHEAEKQLLAEQRAELDRQRIANEAAAKAERERIAAEELEGRKKREAEEVAAAAERKRLLDEQLAKLRAEREEAERVAKADRQARDEAEQLHARARAAEDLDRRERQRIEDEQRREENDAREAALKAERDALDAQRADLERQRSATVSSVAPVLSEPEVVQANVNAFLDSITQAPTAEQIIEVLADHYDVSPEIAIKWLRDAFGTVA